MYPSYVYVKPFLFSGPFGGLYLGDNRRETPQYRPRREDVGVQCYRFLLIDNGFELTRKLQVSRGDPELVQDGRVDWKSEVGRLPLRL